MRSNCCNADYQKSISLDNFHGADDEYELKIPVFHCSKCGKQEIPSIKPEIAIIYKAS